MIPNKLQRGQQFKPSVVDKINQIIDYLKTQRIIGDNKTIKVNQLTNSIALTALSNGTRKGGGSSQIDHPFKLKIGTLQDETSGDSTPTPVLNISQARIIVSGDEASRIYFCYDDNDIGLPTHLKLPEKDGEYNVVGYAVYDQNAPQNEMNMLGWGTGCIYADYLQANTSEFTQSCGFFTFIIGTIKVETDDEGNKKYSITRQLLFSSLDVNDNNINRHFRGHWQKQTYPTDGQIVEDLIADKFIINEGIVLSDGMDYYLTEYEQSGTPSDQNLYCVKFNTDGSICEYAKVSLDEWVYFNEQQSVYLIPICTTYQSSSSAVGLIQFVEGSLIFNIKGKIALNETDQVPSEYLQDKLKYQTKERNTLEEQQKKIYEQNKTYIIGITTDANEQSEADPKVKNLYDDLYWDWTSISEFDKKKHQVIMQQKGDLKWAPASSNVPEISGSLTEILEIKEQQNEDGEVVPLIRYKPQYDKQFPEDENFYFIVQDHQRKITRWTWMQEEKGEGVFVWDYEQKQPLVHIPPSSTDEVSAWVLTGVKDKNMQWMPYTNDASPLQLSGSIQNVFELVDETTGKTLRVLTEYDGSIDQYHFINLDSEGKMQITTFTGEGLDSLMLWNNEEDAIGPTIYDCPEAEQDKLFFLTGDKDNGVLWQNLYDFCQTVKVTEDDSTGDYLFNKVQSADESIIVAVDDTDQYQMLDLTVNPEWFISSDESVIIEYTQEGFLDFTGAGMVQVTEEDQPGFLIDKLGSSLEHITIDVNVDQLGMFADLNLNPETFISSDESIVIEATEDGYIDFTGAGMVQVTDEDTPDFLVNKIASSKEHLTIDVASDELGQYLDLNIDPATFISSDYSVTIEETEDGYIDFTEAGRVQVNANDLPDYLDQKLASEDMSLTIQPGEGNGQSMTMNLQINPEYFFSSDQSIIITATEEGLDFTGAGMVQVTESDQPGFLIDKIVSSKEHLTVEHGSDALGQFVDINIDPATFISSDETIIIEATEDGYIDFYGAGMVQVTEGDQPGFLGSKIESEDGSIIVTPTENIVDLSLNTDIFTSSDGSVIIQPNDNGNIDLRVETIANLQSQKQSIIITDPPEGAQQPIIKIDINPSYFISSDESVTIEETEQGLDFTGAGKVQVNENDTAGFLNEKITSEDNTIIVEDVGSAVDLALNTDIFYSSDESITVESTEQGVDLRSECKVKVNVNDTPGYLAEKLQNNDIINFQDQGTSITAELGAEAIISSDDSVEVEITNGAADIKSKGKVKCTQADTADFLNTKINLDPSVAGLLALEKQDNQILIKSVIQGSGILVVENGVIKPFAAPSSGKYIFACDNGSFSWKEYKDCENACDQ